MLTYDEKTATFLVTFEGGGYIWTCTEFKSLTETIVMDGRTIPYAPRNCGPLAAAEEQDRYVDQFPVGPDGGEWEVRAILQTEDATEYPSNTVTVIH